MDDTSATAVTAALDRVGSRLRRLRTQRRITPTDLATRHRHLEEHAVAAGDGQRRPTLELLLALSHAYRVALDDLVAAPEVGDRRIRLKPGRVTGRTVIPLTRQPGGIQAWKIVIPTGEVTRDHGRATAPNGSTSGHLRLVLGDEDRLLGPGEVTAFDTRVPHWFGIAGDEPAEILSIFGRPGGRMNLRTPPPQPDLSARAWTAGSGGDRP